MMDNTTPRRKAGRRPLPAGQGYTAHIWLPLRADQLAALDAEAASRQITTPELVRRACALAGLIRLDLPVADPEPNTE